MNAEQSLPTSYGRSTRKTAFSAWLRKRRWFILFVIVPTILSMLYYGFIASDIYVSESRFVIKSPDQKRPQLTSLANIIQTTGLSSGQEQANEILEFVRSRDALLALQRGTNIREKFASSNDPIAGFPTLFSGNSFEDLYKYYGKMVDARLDAESGTAILTAKAFSSQDAYRINQSLLQLSEALVNRLNERAQKKAISEVQKQVDLAIDRAKRARLALQSYRNTQDVIDPAKQATGVIEIADTMIANRAALQAQLDLMQRVAPRNPAIPALRNQINAISVQIASQNNRVTGTGGSISTKLSGYEALFVEQQFATESLNAASAALVSARNDAQRQQFYLERIVDANQPDTPLLPRRLLGILIVFAVASCFYMIGWMLIVGILEHAPDN